ncbi:MAG: response regulator transcription factor [Candidatus Brocadiia bacterium]|jgi:two-component system phosphate regulon response regulator PhoB|nr:response regulator transcription factor [Candidatus Brocadiia bacterium]
MAKSTLLVAEDEADMARVLEYNLAQEGYEVLVVKRGDDALAMARERLPDLVLLDLMLPGISGLNVLRELKARAETAKVGVIIVSALGSEDDIVLGLNLGADDYVVKPFRIRELLARVSAACRRGEPTADEEQTLVSGEVTINPSRHEVVANGEKIDLTPSEFAIVAHLARRPGRVFTRWQLCEALGVGDSVQERTIDAHVRTIRKKLGRAGKRIMTVWGVGYKFAEA